MAASQLEQILARLLVPDNEVIKQATKELQVVYKDAGIVYPLCEVMLNSQNPQVRQYAAVILRKKLVKVWTKLSAEDKQRIKVLLLQSLSRERITIVLRSVAHLVSTIAKHELGQSQWSELIEFIMQSCNSTDASQREIGMVALSSLVDAAAVEMSTRLWMETRSHKRKLPLQSQFKALLHLFSVALDDPVNKMVPFYALKSLTCMVEYVGSDELPLFQTMIPKIMAVIKTIIATDEEKACEAMELFDELVECDVGVVTPHLLPLIQFCLELASTQALGSNIRVKGLSFVSWLITLKKKTLLRHGLLPGIITTMLSIMCSQGEEEEEEEHPDEDASESQSPITLAGQVLDVLSLNLPPEKIYPPVMKLVEPLLQSSSKYERSASLVAMAVITEGCADYIRKNHLTSLLQVVYNGVKDSERVVRNAALFALGQFAEHLQPEISKYHSNLMPVLVQFMDEAILSLQARPQEKTGVTKIFYALETFCEHLGEDLIVYLPTLMEKLFYAITTTNNKNVQELVLSAFGAIANACRRHITPYFSKIIEVLNSFIYAQYSQENSLLQSQAVDTLGTLARTVGEETFRPLAQDCVTAGKSLMVTTDPDLRRSVYGMLASVSCVLKEEMAPHLDAITPRMMESLTSEEGVKVHYASFQVDFLDFEDDDSEGGSQDEGVASIEDDDAIEGFSVENAYLEEKEDTCNSLGEIAENLGAHFLPYLDDFYREINILSEHQSEGIRKAAIWTLGKFCLVWYRHVGDDDRENVHYLVNSTLSSFAAVVRTDTDKTVVVSTLETLDEVLKPLKTMQFSVKDEVVSNLMTSIQDVMDNKAECQGDGEDALPGEEGVAEYDSYLEEAAGAILPPLAALAGGEMFLTKFEPILPRLLKKLNGVNSSVSDKSFGIGTLAEIVEALESHARLLVSLYQPFMSFSREDQDDEVCSNSVFGLGVLAKNGLPEMAGNYPAILQHLFSLSRLEKSSNARLMDNICGAICRMVEGNQDAVPLDQVLPLLLKNLPLKEDMEENETIYNCLVPLFTNNSQLAVPHMQQLLVVIAQELSSTSRLIKELQYNLLQLLHQLNSSYPDQVQMACSGLSQEQVLLLTNALQQ